MTAIYLSIPWRKCVVVGGIVVLNTVGHADTGSNLSEEGAGGSVIKLLFDVIINVCNERLGSEFLVFGGGDTGDSFWITGLIGVQIMCIVQLNGASRQRLMNLAKRRHGGDLGHLGGGAFDARQGLNVSMLQRESEIALVSVGQWGVRALWVRHYCWR